MSNVYLDCGLERTAQMRNWCNGCIGWDEGMWRLGRSDASTRKRLLFFIVTFLPRGAKQILGFEEAWQSLILRIGIVWVMQILVSIGVNFQSRAWQQRSSQGSSFTDVVLENIETSKALHFNCGNYLFQFSFPMEPFNTMMHIHKGNSFRVLVDSLQNITADW